MRRYISLASCSTFLQLSRLVTFQELYGRHEDPLCPLESSSPKPEGLLDKDEKKHQNRFPRPHHQLPSSNPWEMAMEEFRAAEYTNPLHVSPEVALSTLQALRAPLDVPRLRRSREASHVWMDALYVLSKAQKNHTDSAVQCAFILFYADQYERAVELTRTELLERCRTDSLSGDDSAYCSSLRLLSVYLMSACATFTSPCADVLRLGMKLLQNSRRVMTCSVAEHHAYIGNCVKIAFWSMDWTYHNHCRTDTTSDDTQSSRFWNEDQALHQLRQAAPPWLPHIFTTFLQVDTDLIACALAPESPPSLIDTVGRHALATRSDGILSDLYKVAEARECQLPDFGLFTLTASRGKAIIVSTVSSDHRKDSLASRALAHKVVGHVGSSLDMQALTAYGNTLRGFKEAMTVISGMSGPAAYAAARQQLFHRPPADTAALQETYGDLLTGDTLSNWKSALATLHTAQVVSPTAWRGALPDTLRLLSDAGKFKEFMRLLPEYPFEQYPERNLSVAASLGHALRRTGRWWQALEVVDLVANSSPPQNIADDFFLQDACLQTMYALRNSNRWKEALALYTSLQEVMPPQAHRVLCSAVANMPTESPWQEALRVAEVGGPIPQQFLRLLEWRRGGGELPPRADAKARAYAVEAFRSGGHYQPLWRAAEAENSTNAALQLWIAALAAAVVSSTAVPLELLTRVPRSLFFGESAAEALKHAFTVAHRNGYLKEYLEILMSLGSDAVVQDYVALSLFISTGQVPSHTVSDPYVAHMLLSLASGRKYRVRVNVREVSSRASPKAVAAALRVPVSCVLQGSNTGGGVVLRPAPVARVPPHHILHCESDAACFMAVFKTAGANDISTARGALRLLGRKETFALAYHVPANVTGIILLYSAALSLANVHMRVRVELRLVPIESAASYPPLLASCFFTKYGMTVRNVEEGTQCATVLARCEVASVAAMGGQLRTMRKDINSEGWTLCSHDDSSGESYHIEHLEMLQNSPDDSVNATIMSVSAQRSMESSFFLGDL